MKLESAALLDQLWRSPALPIWLLLAIAGFVGLILLVALLRAERSIANGTLAALTVLAIGIAVAMAIREDSTPEAASEPPSPQTMASSLPALACLDDLAGETVLAACEKMLFSSPDTAAAAVAQTASQLNRLVARGDVATASRTMTPDLQALRRAIERDRYGLVAYVLSVRDSCKPEQCPAYASLTDHNKIAANMTEKVYEAAIARYEPGWNAPPATAAPTSLMAPTMPTGKPTNTDFPTSASIPPINIMTPEPPVAAPRPPPSATAPPAAPRPATATTAPPAAPKKQPSPPKKQAAPGPVQLSPAAPSTAPAARDE